MVKMLAHLAFTVKDLESSLDFYVNKLGFKKSFEIIRKTDGTAEREIVRDSSKRAYGDVFLIYVEAAPGQFIELFPAAPDAEKTAVIPGNIGYSHFSLIVEDIHALRDELIAKGVKIDRELKKSSDGVTWQMWVNDPDGNAIEFMQYSADSVQVVYSSDS